MNQPLILIKKLSPKAVCIIVDNLRIKTQVIVFININNKEYILTKPFFAQPSPTSNYIKFILFSIKKTMKNTMNHLKS